MGGVAKGVLGVRKICQVEKMAYGMRKAAAGWETGYAERFGKVEFTRGKGVPTVFYNKATGVRSVVHGDDFTFSGTRRKLEKVRS